MLAKNSLYLLSFYDAHKNLSININRDITMMKLAQRLSFLNSSGVHRHTSGLARRAIFVLSLLVFCLGSVWGQEYEEIELFPNNHNSNQTYTIYLSKPNNYVNRAYTELYTKEGYDESRCKVEFRFTVTRNGGISNTWGVGHLKSINGDNITYNPGQNPNHTEIWTDAQNGYGTNAIVTKTYTIQELKTKAKNTDGVDFIIWSDVRLDAVVLLVPKPDDPFLNTAKTPLWGEGSDSEPKDINIDSYGSFSLIKIKGKIPTLPDNIKYARIYVTKDGRKIEYNTEIKGSNLLEVTGGRKAGASEQNGLYVYNGGNNLNLNAINAKLNAGAGSLDKYKIVVLLSTGTITNVNGTPKEPQWEYEYTYSFTYPIIVKTRYKTLVSNNNSQWTTHLLGNWFELAGDCNVGRTELADKLYVRWYLTDLNGNVITNNFGSWNNGGYSQAGGGYSYYRYKFVAGSLDETWNSDYNNFNRGGTGTAYNPTFTLPQGVDYTKVRLVCVASTKTDGYPTNRWDGDREIQAMYIYTLLKPNDVQGVFAHYEGEAYRYLMECGQSDEAAAFGYTHFGDGVQNQKKWDVSTNNYSSQNSSDNIRQNVHTVEYNYYVSGNSPIDLMLPFQDYDNGGSGTEPKAYFRWYNYKTDSGAGNLLAYYDNNNKFEKNNIHVDTNRGLFAFNIQDDPTIERVGVKFNVGNADFSNGEILIACDVSRYLDGMDDSFTYLVHEPTLSVRYLFHIRPASEIATEIAKSKSLDNVENEIMTFGRPTILEDEGRTVVSTNDGYGEFALRTKLNDLKYYYFYAPGTQLEDISESTPVNQAQSLWWYAYYQDDEGNWWRHLIPNKKYRDRDGNEYYIKNNSGVYVQNFYRTQTYQAKYSLKPKYWPIINKWTESDFDGDWEKYNAEAATENEKWKKEASSIPTKAGQRFQMVACVSSQPSADNDDATPQGLIMPIIWTELEFIDAKPLALGSDELKSSKRTSAYMGLEYVHAKTLDFDEFSQFGLQKPNSTYDNFATLPLPFLNAQYGYCYPQLYGLCATMKPILWWEGFGFSSLHGDYMLMKSMNMEGISMDTRGGTNDFNEHSFILNWVNGDRKALYDFTHEHINNNDYGSFLYVDAADEARTIATLEFDAPLCANAKIYYTAYIASMTGETTPKDDPNLNNERNGKPRYGDNPVHPTVQTPPMLRFRVSTTKSGRADDPERVPVVTFVTGNIKQEVNYTGTTEVNDIFKEVQWYQVYGYTTIPLELNRLLETPLNGESRHYFVEIDNYCDNTDGADYCVDQISFYTYSAQVKAQVAFDKCDGDQETTTVRVNADAKTLVGLVGGDNTRYKTLYYRIYEKHANLDEGLHENEALTGKGLYTLADGTPNDLYGAVTIDMDFYHDHSDVDNNGLSSSYDQLLGGIDGIGKSGFYNGVNEDNEQVVFFQLFKGDFVFDSEKTYFISFYDINYTPTGDGLTDANGWGHPYNHNDCSMYSNDIRAFKIKIELYDDDGDDLSNGDVNFACGDIEVEKTYKIKVNYPTNEGEYKVYSNIKFDFFAYSNTVNARELFLDEVNHPEYNALMKALRALRDINEDPYENPEDLPAVTEETKNINADYTEEARSLIAEWMEGDVEDKGRLMLSASTTLNYIFTIIGEKHFAAFPVQRTTSTSAPDEEICSPMDIKFNVDNSKEYPYMSLGFDDVEYPETYIKQVVRVGLKQLDMMRNDGYKLHIPVKSYGNKNKEHGKLNFLAGNNEDVYLTISAVEKEGVKVANTTDPLLTNVGTKFAKIESLAQGASPYVDNEHMYLSLDLKDCEIAFHEGYEYEVSTSFIDEVDQTAEKPCISDLFLIIKVVPEYVTWDSQLIKPKEGQENDTYYSANWYDDKNWKRSERDELYKPAGDSYKDDQDLSTDTYPGYVPMRFTYVTLLTKNHAPSLIAEPKVTGDGKSAANQGGSLIDPSKETGTDMTSTSSPFDKDMASVPTTDIRYDMMVRYIDTATDGKINGGGCFGHRKISENDGWVDATTANSSEKAFDVEKFYGNWAKEIYFKPEAELINQQFLTYEKAWVEKELVANKWYLMSTPLKATYAGDMYVPYEINGTKANGRQETEAFQPITIAKADGTLETGYSRTKYPIYQRSWGMTDGMVYTQKTTDVYRSDYNANLGYTTWSGNMAEWGHTFNDVQVPYTKRTGFAVRAHKEDQKADGEDVKALIRLPKKDLTYYYYLWDGKLPQNTNDRVMHTVLKGDDEDKKGAQDYNPLRDYAQLIDVEKDETETETKYYVEVSLSELQSQGVDDENCTYYLVGNPFMASLDMQKFFEKNTDLEKIYYTYEESSSEPHGTSGKIRPLQAFFVKMESSKITDAKIMFTADMMMDGNHGTPTPASSSARPMMMTAANTRGQSTANVSVGEETKSVATLFDSNLADVPMVYTVANGQAMSINQLTELDKPIAFGVTCAASDEPVAVTFSDIEQLTSGEVYVVDAVTGGQTVVGEGSVLTVQPNDYGRYFLVAGALGIRDQVDVKQGIVVSVRGRVVTVTSGEMLTEVRALSLDGATAQQATAGSTTALLTLATPGVYIIKAENVAGEQQTVKVVVK